MPNEITVVQKVTTLYSYSYVEAQKDEFTDTEQSDNYQILGEEKGWMDG